MPEDSAQLTCAEFQSRLCELLASDKPIEEHPHYKSCVLCRSLVRSFDEMIEDTLGEHFGPHKGPGSSGADDWSEST